MAKKRTKAALMRSQFFNLMARAYLVGEDRPFATEEERRAAWEAHRETLLASARPGMRPGAWWQYDAPQLEAQRLPHESDLQLLFRLGQLGPEEVEALEARGWWPPEPATGQDPRVKLHEQARKRPLRAF